MEIGLMRHYPVNYRFDRWCDSAAFDRNMKHYDRAAIKIPESGNEISGWDACYSSTIPRATKTAEFIWGDGVIRTDRLREVPFKAGFLTRLKMPLALWVIVGRIQWWRNSHRQPESRNMTRDRMLSFYRDLQLKHGEHTRILVVTHGFLMFCFRSFLKKKGFSGPFFLKPANGIIYRFNNRAES